MTMIEEDGWMVTNKGRCPKEDESKWIGKTPTLSDNIGVGRMTWIGKQIKHKQVNTTMKMGTVRV